MHPKSFVSNFWGALQCDVRANYLSLLAEALTEREEPTAETYITLLRGDRGKPLRCRK